jgi:PAS domain S-box-containing protein
MKEIKDTMHCDEIGVLLNSNKKYLWNSENGKELTEKDPKLAGKFKQWDQKQWAKFLKVCEPLKSVSFSSDGSFLTGTFKKLLTEFKSSEVRNYFSSLAVYESIIIIPIVNRSSLQGYFILTHRDRCRWDDRDVSFFEALVQVFGKNGSVEQPYQKSFSFDEKSLTLLDVPIVGILVVKSGKIQYVNRWVEKYLGVSQAELQGNAVLDYIAHDYREMVSKVLESENGDEKEVKECEIEVLSKHKKSRWVECAINKFGTAGNSQELWFWINKEDRQALKKQLLFARKMESLGMLAGGIVHDFNNLIACILGYSSLLGEEIDKDSPYYDDIQQITQTSEKATELTSRLLAFAQGGSFVIPTLEVNQLIKEVAGILSRTLNKNIIIQAELDPELDTIKADPSQIQLAILQIALNSRDAMLNGGKLLFKTKNIYLGENNAWLRLGGKPGRYVQITISDTGSGMTGQVKGRIFEPYFTTKCQKEGKGLGLSMVQEIVENHGGFISVFSEKDKGTVFKIHLLASEKKIQKPSVLPKEKPTLGKETILLVDNEKVLRETARKMLTRYGYKVISAENGAEAVSIYKKYLNRIDLIILDMFLPGMEINRVLSWLKKLNSNVKIIAASGIGGYGNMQQETNQNVAGYVQKPFQVRPLLRKVRTVLNA